MHCIHISIWNILYSTHSWLWLICISVKFTCIVIGMRFSPSPWPFILQAEEGHLRNCSNCIFKSEFRVIKCIQLFNIALQNHYRWFALISIPSFSIGSLFSYWLKKTGEEEGRMGSKLETWIKPNHCSHFAVVFFFLIDFKDLKKRKGKKPWMDF